MALFDFHLRDGRLVFATDLYQFYTYAGLLEGIPSAETSQQCERYALIRARELFESVHAFVFVPPAYYLDEDGNRLLPDVTAICLLYSLTPVRDRGATRSQLMVVTFEREIITDVEEFARRIADVVDWTKSAEDYDP